MCCLQLALELGFLFANFLWASKIFHLIAHTNVVEHRFAAEDSDCGTQFGDKRRHPVEDVFEVICHPESGLVYLKLPRAVVIERFRVSLFRWLETMEGMLLAGHLHKQDTKGVDVCLEGNDPGLWANRQHFWRSIFVSGDALIDLPPAVFSIVGHLGTRAEIANLNMGFEGSLENQEVAGLEVAVKKATLVKPAETADGLKGH